MHMNQVSKKISRGIAILSKLRHFLTNDILTQLYLHVTSVALPYLWLNCLGLKTAVRIMTFSKRDAHSSPLFSQLGLIKFIDLVSVHFAIFMLQYHRNLLPKAFDNFFLIISSKHNYTRLASKSTY